MANKKEYILKVPYLRDLPGGLRDQTLITIQGEPKVNADKFIIDFCKGTDIAFHFNPRYNEYWGPVIVMNSLINDAWGAEKREYSIFPFTRGVPFEIKVLCTAYEFRVEVDDRYMLTFPYRITDLDKITHVHIHGDVDLKSVDTKFPA